MTGLSRLVLACLVAASLLPPARAADRGGKLLGTGGLSSLGGAGGGGITPWALIGGQGTRDQWGANVHLTHVSTSDLELDQTGVIVGVHDRLELSAAEQRLCVRSGMELSQSILGLKLRVLGDAVYDQDTRVPQVALGLQFKDARRGDVLASLGARDDRGVDAYLAATKLLLTRRLLVSGTLRATRANHLGLLGFGGPASDRREVQLEGSLAYLIDNRTVAGVEYRGKPDLLPAAGEDDWKAVFVAFFPCKSVSCALAYVHLGDVAGLGVQDGVHASMQVGF